ncbi:MAG: hypothetical protein ACK4FR_14860, partial [Tabrizicola sp.]
RDFHLNANEPRVAHTVVSCPPERLVHLTASIVQREPHFVQLAVLQTAQKHPLIHAHVPHL